MPGRKRTAVASGASEVASKRQKKQEPVARVLRTVLESAGITLKVETSSNAPVELDCDQVTIKRTLADELTQSRVQDDFMKDFSDFIKDTECLTDVIRPTRYSAGSGLSTRPGGQDSVVRLLLGVEVLQPKLVECLIEAIVLLLNDDDDLALLLVDQLKWLDRVLEGEVLCQKLLEALTVASGGAKRAMIIMLPEILEDAQHHQAAAELKERLNDDPELVPAVVQCLGNLNLTNQDLLAEVLGTALGALQSVNVADIPALMRFIIQSTEPKNMASVVQELRENLDCFTTFEPPMFSSTQGRENGQKPLPDEVAVLETLQFLICFQKSVADAWLKAIQAVSTASGHQVVDILVLLILYTLPTRKKAVVNLLTTKIKKKQFTEDLLARVFGIGSASLKEYFPCILSFAGSLLCSPSVPVVNFASAIYVNAFKCFDVFFRQEIVGAVVTHVGSGFPSEVDAAFDVLLSLVKADVEGMRRFDIFIKGMLDYLEKLTMPQIRKLYAVISSLAQDADSALWDEMCTIIVKQLSHADRQFRHIGVIGGVMMITQLAQKMDSETKLLSSQTFPSTSAAQSDVLSSSRLQSAKALLDRVMLDGCMRSADSTTLFNDEMAQAVLQGNLDPDFLQLISTRSTDTLEDVYLIESTEALPSDMAVSLEYNAGLDSIDSCSVALNMVPMVIQQHDQLKRGMADRSSVMCLRSHFHLLRACVASTGDGSLSEIDALLGCPVVMCASQCLELDSFKSLQDSTRESVCLSLFLCVNWYLESLCAFAGIDDPDMQWKVLKRLQKVTEVENQLEACMTATPSFVGFLHRVLGVEMELSAGSSGLPGGGKKKGGKARQAKGSKSVNVTTTTLNNTAAETTQEVSMVEGAQPQQSPSLEAVRPFYRPLTVDVYKVLSYEPIERPCSQGSPPTQTPHVNEVAKLEPPQIVFLLDNFLAKVASTLSLFGSKRARPHSKIAPSRSQLDGGNTPSAVAQLVVTLLPAFCQHLESASAFFQSQREDNDGIEDMYELGSQEARAHCTILSTTFKIIATVLGWPRLTGEDNAHLVQEMCKVFARRLGSDNGTEQESLFEQGLLYLKGFASSVPTLTSAQALTKCLVNLCRLSPAQGEHRTVVANVACSLLKKPWTEFGSTQQQKEAIGTILKFYISWSKDPLQQIEIVIKDNFMSQVEKEMAEEEEGEEESQQTYATFSVKTMSCYYQMCMSTLVDTVKGALAHKEYTTSPVAMDQGMVVLSVSVRILQMLINLVKTTEKRPILGAALKHGRQFIEVFVRSGIPLLNVAFRTKQDEVLALLKSLQQSTRSLQHFCGHSKVQRDVALTNSVPALKRSLETLLFKVKFVLADHNCQEAFWVGNLKNRDLRGQEVLSQQTQDSPESDYDDAASVVSGSATAEEQDNEVILSSEEDD